MPRKRRAAPAKPGYTIGITIFVKADGELGLFENGLRQNVLFLYLLFKNSPNCARVYLLNHGDGDRPRSRRGWASRRTPSSARRRSSTSWTMSSALGAAMDRETVMALRPARLPDHLLQGRQRRGHLDGGDGRQAAARPDAELYFDHDYYDAIWMTPQHIHTYRGWCETIYRCPVLRGRRRSGRRC